jgi:hypothetical protein
MISMEQPIESRLVADRRPSQAVIDQSIKTVDEILNLKNVLTLALGDNGAQHMPRHNSMIEIPNRTMVAVVNTNITQSATDDESDNHGSEQVSSTLIDTAYEVLCIAILRLLGAIPRCYCAYFMLAASIC